jgi:septum formation protein
MTLLARRSIVLASASVTRAQLLERAGLRVLCDAAAVDEAEVKAAFRAEKSDAATCATALAEAKAERVSRRHPGDLVVAADQILDCNGVWFDKPPDLAHARAQLMALSGRRHELVTAVTVFRDGENLWHVTERARLRMRALSADFVDAYLAACGESVLGSVGAYQLEGLGAQLFDRVEGDFFAILGLPLLPLLGFLREHGVVSS